MSYVIALLKLYLLIILACKTFLIVPLYYDLIMQMEEINIYRILCEKILFLSNPTLASLRKFYKLT